LQTPAPSGKTPRNEHAAAKKANAVIAARFATGLPVLEAVSMRMLNAA
jgi:hypothetical protein